MSVKYASLNLNRRGFSDSTIRELMLEDRCPLCLGELDTGWECNSCGYDAMPLADRYELDRIRREGRESQ